jgi:probable HAF family extracellular repeat protein
VDLGILPGGNNTFAWAINSLGQVGGEGRDANNVQVPFYWSSSTGFVALPENTGDYRNYAFGINDSGDLTGQRYTGEVVHAFLWIPSVGTYHVIGSLPGGLHSVGNAINNLRHITGTASTSTGRFDAFFWKGKRGELRDIGSIAGGSYTAGEAINNSDQVVGFGTNRAGKYVGFFWSRSTGMTLLETLGGIESVGFGINSSGAIAGYATNTSGVSHAVVWSDQTSAPTDLGTLPGGASSLARSINSLGQVVGFSDVP